MLTLFAKLIAFGSGARKLCMQQLVLPPEQQYLRCVETVHLPDHQPFVIIICMFPAMSRLLLTTRRPSIDTTFKRAYSYEEFKLETWFPEHIKCTCPVAILGPLDHPHTAAVCTRAFIMSQTAAAHHYLFRRIFDLVEHDTGQPVHFQHIHGDGIETIVADAHKCQALGKPHRRIGFTHMLNSLIRAGSALCISS
jgi:hypothetical protein